jgi:signal transduction histidine kinase
MQLAITLRFLAVAVLLGVGVCSDVHAQPGSLPDKGATGWTILEKWKPDGGVFVFEARSEKLLRDCVTHRDWFVQFPTVVHGVHEIFLDGRRVITWGDPSYRTTRSFYGAPTMTCSELAGSASLVWRVRTYTQAFTMFQHFPEALPEASMLNFFAESLNLMAGGGFILMSIFLLVMFWGKIPEDLVLTLVASSLCLSAYFLGTVPGLLGFQLPMLAMEKLSEINLWFGVGFFFNALRIHGLFGWKVFWLYLANLFLATVIIFGGKDGDTVQFGTSIPFVLTMAILICSTVTVAMRIYHHRSGPHRPYLELLSLTFLTVTSVNDMLVIQGYVSGYMLLSLGYTGGLLFFAFSVKERIDAIYGERDYLKEHLEEEVERKTHELRIKTRDLEAAMDELKGTQAELVHSAKLASLGTLSAGIAHEINNALNFVYGALKPMERLVMETITESERKDKIAKLFQVMHNGLKLTFDIIRSLRNYTGLNQAKFNDISLKEVIETVLTILKSKLRDRIEVALEVPEGLVVYGSVVGLNQVFMNLVSNAVDAMPQGGSLKIIALSDQDTVRVTVTDSGGGIPSEILQRIFEPFFTTKEVGKGTGLGLYIAASEIKRHNGKISVESDSGKGTTFTILLPGKLAVKEGAVA